MTTLQKTIKYVAMAFAVFLIVNIFAAILGAAGLFTTLYKGDGVDDRMKSYEISDNITDIKIEIGAADFTVAEGDVFSLESNLKHLSVKEKGGCLIINEARYFGRNYNGAKLNLCLPSNILLKTADISTGAGRVSIDRLSAEELKMELGAGEVIIDSLTATKEAEIDGGAGRLEIRSGELSNLDLDMGVGGLKLTSRLMGDSDCDLGVGSVELNLIGDKDEYRIKIDKGVGNAFVGGDAASDGNIFGNGKNSVDINGGVGEIKVSYKESEQK